jgi:hypothetical protein
MSEYKGHSEQRLGRGVVIVGVVRPDGISVKDVLVGQLLVERDLSGRLREMMVEFYEGAEHSPHLVGDTLFFYSRKDDDEVVHADVETWSARGFSSLYIDDDEDPSEVAHFKAEVTRLEAACEEVIARVHGGDHIFIVKYDDNDQSRIYTPNEFRKGQHRRRAMQRRRLAGKGDGL